MSFVLLFAGILTFWMVYWFVRRGGIDLFRKPPMVEDIYELIYGKGTSSPPPRTKPSRLYLGSPEKFIEIDDWDVFRKKTIAGTASRGVERCPHEGARAYPGPASPAAG